MLYTSFIYCCNILFSFHSRLVNPLKTRRRKRTKAKRRVKVRRVALVMRRMKMTRTELPMMTKAVIRRYVNNEIYTSLHILLYTSPCL